MKKRLLLADDSVTIQKVVQITFSHDDYELTVVDNGDLAYEKARSQRPDLILADVFMPGKNGYELCAAVKNDPALAAVPVLLLTGTFEPFDEAKAKLVGADRWIAKPFESQALIACVEELLSLAAQAPAMIPPLLASSPPVSSLPEDADEFAPRAAVADLPDDLWGNDFPEETTVNSSAASPEDSFAPLDQDDLWDVSGFDSEVPAVAADDLWSGSFAETATPPGEESAPEMTTAARTDDPWEEDDFSTALRQKAVAPDDSVLLGGEGAEIPLVDDDIEILEEIDLLEPLDDYPLESPLSDPFASCDFSFGDETVPAEVAATPPASVPVVPTPLLAAELPAAPAASTAAPALSAAELELIVEKVANVVISRLAGTLLEKIAWEVVPDLAETMIKEELRKIREAVVAD
jgi:CheY-like chemotaxis protein